MKEGNMKPLYYLMLFVVLLTACSSAPSGDAVQTAIVQTEMARPTKTFVFNPTAIPIPEATNTPIPLGELDLEPVIFMTGDLPSNYQTGVFYKEIPGLIFFTRMSNFPVPDSVTSLDIDDTLHPNSYGGYETSRVSVMLYNDLAQRDVAYEKVIDPNIYGDNPVEPLDNVGERAVTIKVPMGYEYVIFTRCNALVFMQTNGDTANYAQRLDERLTPLVCR